MFRYLVALIASRHLDFKLLRLKTSSEGMAISPGCLLSLSREDVNPLSAVLPFVARCYLEALAWEGRAAQLGRELFYLGGLRRAAAWLFVERSHSESAWQWARAGPGRAGRGRLRTPSVGQWPPWPPALGGVLGRRPLRRPGPDSVGRKEDCASGPAGPRAAHSEMRPDAVRAAFLPGCPLTSVPG